MYCPNCGYKNDEDADFCEHCGSRLEPGDVSEPSPGKKRGNLIVAVLAAVICVGIAGILVYLLVLSPEKENKSFTADASYQEELLIDILFDDPLVKLNSAIIDYNHCQWQGLRRHKCPIDNDFVYEAKQSSRA